jgi:hypothetical protein
LRATRLVAVRLARAVFRGALRAVVFRAEVFRAAAFLAFFAAFLAARFGAARFRAGFRDPAAFLAAVFPRPVRGAFRLAIGFPFVTGAQVGNGTPMLP